MQLIAYLGFDGNCKEARQRRKAVVLSKSMSPRLIARKIIKMFDRKSIDVAFLLFDGFTEIDFFTPWDIFNRVSRLEAPFTAEPLRTAKLCDQPFVRSISGLRIDADAPFSSVKAPDASLFPGARR